MAEYTNSCERNYMYIKIYWQVYSLYHAYEFIGFYARCKKHVFINIYLKIGESYLNNIWLLNE